MTNTPPIGLGLIHEGEVIQPNESVLSVIRLWLERLPIMSPDERTLSCEVINLLVHPPILMTPRSTSSRA